MELTPEMLEAAMAQAEKEGKAWSELTPEEKERMARDYEAERGQLTADMDYAESEMDLAGPEGRKVTERVYVAANPLEHLTTALRKRKGKKDRGTAREAFTKSTEDAKKGKLTEQALLARQNAYAKALGDQRMQAQMDAMAKQKQQQAQALASKQAPPNAPMMRSAGNPAPQQGVVAQMANPRPQQGGFPDSAAMHEMIKQPVRKTAYPDALRRKKEEELMEGGFY